MAKESNSSVVRVHKNTDFTIMSNHHLRNQKLTLKAVGLMSKILGLPDGWNYSVAGLVKICREGETAVRAALKFHTRICLMVWNALNYFSKNNLKQIKMQILQIQKNKMQKTYILKFKV